MAKAFALLALSGLLLAGCSSGPEGGDARTTAVPTYTVTAQSPQAAVLTTDTYHLLAPPEVTPRAPTAQDPIRVPVEPLFDRTARAGQGERFWDATLPQDLNGFVGNASLVVEVTGTLLADPRNNLAPGCFWNLAVSVGDPNTSTEYRGLGCVKEGPQVPPGLYRLSIPFALTDVSWPAGTVLHFDLHTYEQLQRTPGAAADLLTGAVGYDSAIQVYGLELPLDGALLLQAT